MKSDIHFWLANLLRGFIAILGGSAILVIPDMARTLLLLPMAVVLSILGLACYGVIDSTLVFITSFMAESRQTTLALRFQGLIGMIVGILLLTLAYERVHLVWFLYLAAFQAMASGVAELFHARHTAKPSQSRWDYITGTVGVLCGCGYVVLRLRFADSMSDGNVFWSIYAYLIAFGIAQCLTAARQLYADSWKLRMGSKQTVMHEA